MMNDTSQRPVSARYDTTDGQLTITLQSSSAAGLLALLAESSRLLDQATAIEEQKLPPLSDEALQRSFPEYAAALALVAKLDQLLAPVEEPAIDLPAVVTEPAVDFLEPAAEPAVDVPEVAEVPGIDPLQEALAKCAQATQDGYRMAMQHLDDSEAVIRQAQEAITRINRTAGSDQANAPVLERLNQSITDLKAEHDRQRQLAWDKSQELETFNITLFGRTMAGKSTLMEILTKGNGTSIGNGAQRKTRDVRKYQWQGLTVADVPGIAAFGGEDDEKVAHQATNQADLVLFMVADDGVQDAEAQHLARLRQEGRPLLGICNVKVALNSNTAIRRFIRDQDKHFDQVRLDQISRQFDEMADQYTPGRELPLVSSHLLAKFKADPSRMDDSELRVKLEEASRFRQVEGRIQDEVITNGTFLRTRSFLDSAAVSTLETSEGTLEIASQFNRLNDRIGARVQELNSWRTSFSREANLQFDQLIRQTVGNLRNQISSFAEQYCEDRSISDHWNQRIQSAGIERQIQRTQEALSKKCEQRFRTLIEEIQEEIRLVEVISQRLIVEAGPIHNSRRTWNWGVTGLTGAVTVGLGIAALTNIWNPVGWVAGLAFGAIAVVGLIGGLVGRLFGSRDKKRREAIDKIKPALQKNLDDIEAQIRSGMKKWLDDFTREYVNKAIEQFRILARQYEQAATAMRETAQRQRDNLLHINRQTIETALRHLRHPRAISRIAKVARIPGQSMVLTTGGSSQVPTSVVSDLESLFNESVELVTDNLNVRQVIESLTKGYRRGGAISVDDTTRTARVQFDPADRQAQVQIRLASQLTGYYISNQTGA